MASRAARSKGTATFQRQTPGTATCAHDNKSTSESTNPRASIIIFFYRRFSNLLAPILLKWLVSSTHFYYDVSVQISLLHMPYSLQVTEQVT